MSGKYRERFLKQATSQVEAAGPRAVRWYFAEKDTADFARDLFSRNHSSAAIKVFHVEALGKWL